MEVYLELGANFYVKSSNLSESVSHGRFAPQKKL